MPNPTPFVLAVFLLLLCAVAAILAYRVPEARATLSRWVPWLVAAGIGVLWLLSLFWRRSSAAMKMEPTGEGHPTTRPTPPSTIGEVKAEVGVSPGRPCASRGSGASATRRTSRRRSTS